MWLPGVERIPGNSAGAMAGGGARKILLHTTEGSTIAGATAAFQANNSWPHFTVNCNTRQVVEHLDMSVAARSLRNVAGGVETNRQGTILVQIEIVGFAANQSTLGSTADLAWFGSSVVGPIARLCDVPVRSTVRWVAYPDSYGPGPQRLSGTAWSVYSGVLGHEHAPENVHGDPGAIDIATILAAAAPPDPAPLPPSKDGKMLYLVKTADAAAWWLTDLVTKRWIQSREDANVAIALSAAAGQPVFRKADTNDPYVLGADQADVLARVPTVGPEPTSTTPATP